MREIREISCLGLIATKQEKHRSWWTLSITSSNPPAAVIFWHAETHLSGSGLAIPHQSLPEHGVCPGGTAWTFRQGPTEVAVTVHGHLRVRAAEGVREGVLAGLGVSVGGSECLN